MDKGYMVILYTLTTTLSSLDLSEKPVHSLHLYFTRPNESTSSMMINQTKLAGQVVHLEMLVGCCSLHLAMAAVKVLAHSATVRGQAARSTSAAPAHCCHAVFVGIVTAPGPCGTVMAK